MQHADDLYMQRCLDLALQGIGRVAPNPMVGCVIVHDGNIIGEGLHQAFGGPHSEVNAIQSVKKENHHLLSSSVLYVNLEPCSHYGKTPPCADLIIEKKIPKIIIGTPDPNPLVSGRGVEKLKDAGCEVITGILESACNHLNKRFFTFVKKKRPYIILKWAQTTDGFIAPENKQATISNEYSRTLVHKWRSEESAIMVGTTTALVDDPVLDARMWNQQNPLRIVLDNTFRLPQSLHLFDGNIPTIVFTSKQKEPQPNIEFVTIDFNNQMLNQMLQKLYDRNILSVLVEGGAKLLQTFIDSNLWDEARIFIAAKNLRTGVIAPKASGTVFSKEKIGADELIIISNTR